MMKRILFITPFAPSNIGAAMKFTKTTIEALAEEFLVDLVYFTIEGELQYLPENKNISIRYVGNITRKDRILNILQKPRLFPIFSVRYNWKLGKMVAGLMKAHRYDLMFLDHSQSFIYGRDYPEVPKILMSHDVIYQRISRTSNPLIARFCHATEKKMLSQENAHRFSFSTKDQEIIEREFGLQSYVTCGNVDPMAVESVPQTTTNDFIFFGQWVRSDNAGGLEWFLDNVYPLTSADVRIKIIGRGLSEKLMMRVKEQDRVEYLGFVDNPYQMIADARAVLSPLFTGAGVKFKVLEALACGTPVIGNEIAFEGIPEGSSDYMLMAHTPEEYIRTMESISYSMEERTEMKRRFIREYINPYIVKHIEKILR